MTDQHSGRTQIEARATNAVLPALRAAGEWLPLSARRAVADAVLAELKRELDALADYENRITWNTTCGSCARVLDSSIQETHRADRAENAIARARSLHRETCPLARGKVGRAAFTCGICDALDQPSEDQSTPQRDCRIGPGQPEARLRCPRCGEDITDYAEGDHVYRTGDDRPYCSGECVVAAHRARVERSDIGSEFIQQADSPDQAGVSAFEESLARKPSPKAPSNRAEAAAVASARALHQQYRFAGDDTKDYCAHCNQISGGWIPWPCPTIQAIDQSAPAPPGHDGQHQCQPCTERHGAPAWDDTTKEQP